MTLSQEALSISVYIVQSTISPTRVYTYVLTEAPEEIGMSRLYPSLWFLEASSCPLIVALMTYLWWDEHESG